MLLNQRAAFSPRCEEPLQSAASGALFATYLRIARRQYRVFLCCLLLAVVIGGLFLLTAQPIFTAGATMMIDARKGGIQQKSVLGDTPTDAAAIDSQIGVLTLERDKVGLRVVQKLQLANDKTLVEPSDQSGNALIDLISKPLQNRIGGLKEKPESEAELTQQAASAVASGLEVKRVGFTYLVTINFSARNSSLVVKVANAAADAYVVAEMDAKYQAIRQASDWLEERYQTLREQASAADRAVIDFKNKNNIVTVGGKLIGDQQIGDINTRVVNARARTDEAQARYSQIEDVLRSQEVGGTVDATVSDTLNNPIITKLRAQYLDLVNREADWSARFGRDHLAVVNLRNQARDLERSIHEELKRISETYKSDLEVAKKDQQKTERQLADAVSQIPNDAQITLRGLESSAQSYRTFYDNFFLNYTESVQQQSSPIPDTQVVSYASGAYKSYPSTPRVVVMTILGGLVLGIGLVLLREMMDRAFRTSEQVEAALQTECIALIPMVNNIRQIDSASAQKLTEDPRPEKQLIANSGNQITICPGSGSLQFLIDAPFSRFAECIRAIKLAADLRGDRNSAKVIGFTSSLPGEGKSTIATALAGLAGAVGERTILLDCDLRNPALSRLLTPNAAAGIIEVISGGRSLNETIWKEPTTDMAFLPAVNVSYVPNTDQILAGDAMKRLFDLLRTSYEYIIVDLSPLAPVVDVRATTGLIDFYVLLIEWGHTKIEVVQQALKEAREVHDNVLGVVLNKVDMKVISQYEGYRGEYYNNHKFAQYGYTD